MVRAVVRRRPGQVDNTDSCQLGDVDTHRLNPYHRAVQVHCQALLQRRGPGQASRRETHGSLRALSGAAAKVFQEELLEPSRGDLGGRD